MKDQHQATEDHEKTAAITVPDEGYKPPSSAELDRDFPARAGLDPCPPGVLEQLKSKHTVVFQLDSGDGDFIVVRRAKRDEFRRWQAKVSEGGPNARGMATENLVNTVLVHPAPDVFREALEARPMLATSFGGGVLEIAGAAQVQKKTFR